MAVYPTYGADAVGAESLRSGQCVYVCPYLVYSGLEYDDLTEPPMPQTAASPQLLTVAQAASLLRVSEKTMRRWIEADRVPYLRLPSGGYRIPQGALIASLGGTYDLAAEIAALDTRAGTISDEDVRKAAVDD